MKRKTVKCELCGTEISLSNYSKHKGSKNCKNIQNGDIKHVTSIPDDLCCRYCNLLCKNKKSFVNHERLCKNNPNKEESNFVNYNKNNEPWNTGLTKVTDERVKKNGISISKTIQNKIKNDSYKPNCMSDSAKQKLSERMSLHNPGGKCKWYKVNGVSVQGTWERDIAIMLENHEIRWEKIKTNNQLFKYEICGKIKSYAPDFYLPEYNIYLEIKGYWWGSDKEKMQHIFNQFPNHTIIIVEKEQYLKILSGGINEILQVPLA